MNKNSGKYYTDQKIGDNIEESKELSPAHNSQYWEYVQPNKAPKREMWFDNIFLDKETIDTPIQIKKLLQIFQQEPWLLTRNKSFYEQALYMADYEDDTPIVAFFEYFPVYRSMNIAQLRSYFTFRTLVRKGQYPEVSLSYIFVYIYEILMQIGVAEPNKGLDLLENIKKAYSISQPKLVRYLELWMKDYIAYYNLTDKIDTHFADQIQEDITAKILTDYQNISDELLFDTASSLSAYKVKNASFFKKYPAKMIIVASRAIRTVAPIYELRYGHHIDELCLGLRKQIPHPMFVSAIFYNPHPVKENIFKISLRRCYQCKSGLWSIDTFNEKIFARKGELLGKILHETDRRLRISLKGKPSMVTKMDDKEIEAAIQSVIDNYLKELDEEARPKIKVDFSKLDKIRSDADIIRDALLSGEEGASEEPLDVETDHAKPFENGKESLQENDSLLTKEECGFLHLLLSNGNWTDYLRSIHVPVGVMTDNINEKLMEDLNDILIDEEGNGPFILDDYKDYIANKI